MYFIRHLLSEVVVPNDDRHTEFINLEGYRKYNSLGGFANIFLNFQMKKRRKLPYIR